MIRFVDISPTWDMYNVLVNNEYIQLSHRPLPSQLYSSQDTTNLIYTGTTKLKNAYGDYTSLQLRAFATDGYIRVVEVTVETSQRITGLALSPFIRYKLEESEPFIGFMISDELVEEDKDMKIPIEPNSKSKLLFHYFMGHTVHGSAKFPTVADLQAGRIEIEFQLGGQMFGLTEIP